MKILLQFLLVTTSIIFSHFTLEANNQRKTNSEPGIILSDNFTQTIRAVILSPADSIINGYPLLKVKPVEDNISSIVYNLFENSYMRQSVILYYLIQNFLINIGELESCEPAYLLLSQNHGGFPKFGFYLLHNDSIYDKTNVPYVELVKNNTDMENHLGSMTQIYPHEMGHIFYHMLSKDSDSTAPGSIDIHYSTLTTDYRTAYNEGFAMHFENISRNFDPDTNRIRMINEDFLKKKKQTGEKIVGYKRDFFWPLRIGFYRASMIAWYQNFEDIKRFEWVNNSTTRFQNSTSDFNNPEKSLFYRNSGIEVEEKLKSPQRMISTEGVIASFFVNFITSGLHDSDSDTSIYNQFITDSINKIPGRYKSLTKLEKQYIKIFYILRDCFEIIFKIY